jgi:hypothetical protein
MSIQIFLQKTFENNGFVDFEDNYEDPSPLIGNSMGMENDLDSGYQEPQEINQQVNRSPMIPSSTASTLQRPRQLVSTPQRIINPNIPPLNSNPNPHYHPDRHYRSLNKSSKNNSNASINANTINSINKRTATTLNRRVSDVANS